MARIGPDVNLQNPAFVHETACLYGKVTIAEHASVWANVVARAELAEIRVGAYTNIQDFVMLHIGSSTPTIIGEHCSITHHCTIHGCTIGDNCLIGINSTIMDGCVIGDNCIIGGHSFLKEGTVIPDNSIVMGSPATVKKQRNSFVANRLNAFLYYKNALAYANEDYRAWVDPEVLDAAGKEYERLQALVDAGEA